MSNQPSRGRGHASGRAAPHFLGGRNRGGPLRGRGGNRGGTPGNREWQGSGNTGSAAEVFNADVPAVLDARLASCDALIESFEKVPKTNEMPLRPNWGTEGQAIMLRANFFPLELPAKFTVYDYDVAITPKDKRLSSPLKARIFELLEGSSQYAPYVGYVAHDRSQRLVSAKMLPQPLSVDIPFLEEGEAMPRPNAQVYSVEFTFVRVLNEVEMKKYLNGSPSNRGDDIAPLLSALDLLVQKHASKAGVRVGSNRYFFPSMERYSLDLGIEACKGFFVSVRPTYKQLMVNINVCMAAFYVPGNLAEAMLAFNKRTGGMPAEFSNRLQVITRHLGYTKKYTVRQIMGTPASRTNFKYKGRKDMISVENYFKEKYPEITLRHAGTLPVIYVGKTQDGNDNYLPAEICEIPPNQAYRAILSADATSAMLKVASNSPAKNANSIVHEGLPLLGLGDRNETLANFGISVSQAMAVIPGRLLPPPQIVYKSGRPPVVNEGSWNLKGVGFHKPASMGNWAVLLIQAGFTEEFGGVDDPALHTFLEDFKTCCQTSGMIAPPGLPRIIVTPRLPSPQHAQSIIENTLADSVQPEQKPSFILVLLPDKSLYSGLKRLCDVRFGIHTVCMFVKKARDQKGQLQYFANVALKVNSKLGGINHSLDPQSMRWLNEKKTVFVGIDVTHPSPKSKKGAPSIAAVVASADDKFGQFPASLRLQTNRNVMKDAEEMTQELTEMLVERLVAYKKNVQALPARVIVYRDGVSEGQYKLVLEKELPQILAAFDRFNTRDQPGTYRPSLSIVVCGKRHHARFPATSAEHTTQNGNTLPGTVVDKGVTDIYNFDFYLQAHKGLQGTVRPTHYTIVYDENRLDADTIQTGIHNTSYLYARATKAVSLVPPAYYADLACERARCYLGALLDSDDARSASSKGKSKGDQEAERMQVYEQAVKMWGNGVHDDLKNSMFYI